MDVEGLQYNGVCIDKRNTDSSFSSFMTKKALLRVGRIVVGGALVVLGILGLFLPVLQGILFLVIGLTLLAPESRHARRLLRWLRERFPRRSKKAIESMRYGGMDDAG